MTSNDWADVSSGFAGRRQRAFGAARRHTRVVRVLRFAIPVGAVFALIGMIAVPVAMRWSGVQSVSVASIGISDGKVRMQTPKLSGYRKDNRPYEVTAVSALQEIRNPTQVELQTLTARLQTQQEGWVTVNSRTGFFNTQSEKLQLNQDVRILTEQGYDIRLNTADVDFKAGTVQSKEPVKVMLGTTTVDADTLDVKDNGAMISFAGRVKVFIQEAPARTIVGPEREGSTPRPDLLQQQQGSQPANGQGAAAPAGPHKEVRQ